MSIVFSIGVENGVDPDLMASQDYSVCSNLEHIGSVGRVLYWGLKGG